MEIDVTAFLRRNRFELDSRQKSIVEYNGKNNVKSFVSFLKEKRILNKLNKTIVGAPYPFLKWAGGKRQLLNKFSEYFPGNFKNYIEPFVGGGAVFFYLLPNSAILIDNNEELINCYKIIQNQVEELILSLKQHRNEKEYYYQIRNIDRNRQEFSKWSNIERASRTIYLNKCCFNGLYRVNNKGQFNVPFGEYTNPKFCDEKNLKAVSSVLKNVQIMNSSFEKCLDFAEKDDFIYFDPPYVPISETASFTSYTKDNFGPEDQRKLFRVFKELDERRCKIILSNSYCEFILDLYRDYHIEIIEANRAINSDGTKRGKIKEVLIFNDDNISINAEKEINSGAY